MAEGRPVLELENKIGYQFKNQQLLDLALTHSSFANRHRGQKNPNNERLEFLGDAVLELYISDYLFHEFSSYDEGKMTKLRASLVCENTLAICAKDICLGDYLKISRGEEITGGRERDSILSDAFEALIGAIYLDGGPEEARTFIINNLLCDVEDKSLYFDAKTILQEKVQAGFGNKLYYRTVRVSGPDHNKEFTVVAVIDGREYASGTGKSRKGAEQLAAYQTILMLKNAAAGSRAPEDL